MALVAFRIIMLNRNILPALVLLKYGRNDFEISCYIVDIISIIDKVNRHINLMDAEISSANIKKARITSISAYHAPLI